MSIDYASINDDTEREVKMIIGKCETTGNLLGHHVMCKGLADEWATKRVVKDMEELDKAHCILKTDGEPAIIALQNRIQALREGRTVPRNPPAYNPQSNGPCEKAVHDVTAHLRTLKLALESRLKVEIDDNLPIVQWMIEHAVFLLNKFGVGPDGMTPFERLTGRKWKRPVLEVGEVCLAKLAIRRDNRGARRVAHHKSGHRMKLKSRSIDAVWVGQIARTGEHVVIKSDGNAVRCRTVRRVPEEHRWSAERVLLIRATPRVPAPASNKPEIIEPRLADDEGPTAPLGEVNLPAGEPTEDSGVKLEQPEVRGRDSDVREFRITNRLLEKYGFTDECVGCTHKATGGTEKIGGHLSHSIACRERLRRLMAADTADRGLVTSAYRRKYGDGQQAADDPQSNNTPQEPTTTTSSANKEHDNTPENDHSDTDLFANEPNDYCNEDEPKQLVSDDDDDDESMNGKQGNDDPLADLKRRFDDEDGEDEPTDKRQRVQAVEAPEPRGVRGGLALPAEEPGPGDTSKSLYTDRFGNCFRSPYVPSSRSTDDHRGVALTPPKGPGEGTAACDNGSGAALTLPKWQGEGSASCREGGAARESHNGSY